jgi:phosphonate transport system permease protein
VLLTEQLSAMARRSVMGSADTGSNPFGMRARMRAARVAAREAKADAARKRATRTAGVTTTSVNILPTAKIAAPWTATRVGQWTGGVIAAVAVVGSFVLLGFGPVQLWQALAEIGPYVAAMFPPDFVTNFVPHLELMLETIWMALVATVLGLIISLPIGIIGARNATFHPIAAKVSRFLTVAVRGMPELIIAVLLVVAFGLGPVAGMLALTIGSIGLAGKLIADAIEDTDLTGPTESMNAVGASWLQRTVTSTIPQCAPSIIGTGLYMFDVFVRAATTLGIVGAGGIGLALDASIRGRNMDQTLAIIIMIFIAVYGIERLSAWFRKQIL